MNIALTSPTFVVLLQTNKIYTMRQSIKSTVLGQVYSVVMNISRLAGIIALLFLAINVVQAQSEKAACDSKGLIYIEVDPFAYINKGYSVHLGYENWGFRFDLTKVQVDFPEAFEDAFYSTTAFDLVTKINGIKIDYIGNRTNWTRGAFVGLDLNHQTLSFTHRETKKHENLTALNLGVRAGYKFNIYKGLYITPWAAVWRNVADQQTMEVASDDITTNKWDWITTLHIGYAYKF